MSAITQGTKFPVVLVNEIFNKVKGHSSIAKMVGAQPIPFNGKEQFVFSLDSDVSIVGEGANKPAGDATLTPVTIRPIKVVYQSRITDEFMRASEEARLSYLKEFADAFSKRIANGLDLMAMHGVNPATGTASDIIGHNYLDYVIKDANKIEYLHDSTAADVNIDEALAKVDDANGVILGKTIRAAIAALNINGARKYPEFAWGATPATLGGMTLDSNATVEANSSDARAYVGDWSAFKWGFADELPLEIIQFGDPDGQGDLKRSNQILLRSEAYIGWGILDADAFAEVVLGE